MIFGVVIKPEVERALMLARELIAWAKKCDQEIALEEESAELLEKKKGCSYQQLAQTCDAIITLGGDGTLLGVARFIESRSPLLVGVNFGTLGFLTEISPHELFGVLEEVLAGQSKFSQRSMLRAQVIRGDSIVFSAQGLNDAVLQKGNADPLMTLEVFAYDQTLMQVRADGLIVATPTGSTAYSLAAGGSIVHPSLEVMLLTPLLPHSLTARPLMVPIDMPLAICIPEVTGEAVLSLDGQLSSKLCSGDRVEIRRSENSVRIASSPSKSYFDILRTKLNWAIPNRGE